MIPLDINIFILLIENATEWDMVEENIQNLCALHVKEKKFFLLSFLSSQRLQWFMKKLQTKWIHGTLLIKNIEK